MEGYISPIAAYIGDVVSWNYHRMVYAINVQDDSKW
jgi:hypothetical protein